MEAKLEKVAEKLEKHGDAILRLMEREKHLDAMLEQFHKESDAVRQSIHKLRNDMQALMGDFHSFRKTNSLDVLSYRITSRKDEINNVAKDVREMGEEVHSLAIEAHAATENTTLLQDIQQRLRALEVQMPLLQSSKSWMDKGMMALMVVGMAFLTGKAILGSGT